MTKTKMLLIALFAMVAFTGCTRVKIPSGHVGVHVDMYGGDKGVDSVEILPGKVWIAPWKEEIHIFPTLQQSYSWTKSASEGSPTNEEIGFQTIEGAVCHADIGIEYHLELSKISDIFQEYRLGVDELTSVKIRNFVRDAFVNESASLSVEDMYGTAKIALKDSVFASLNRQLNSHGIFVDKISYLGQIRIPPNVAEALNAKVQITQQAQCRENELQMQIAQSAIDEEKAKGEAAALIAAANGRGEALLVEATAQAEANELISRSLTSNLLRYEEIQKWNGVRSQVTGGNTITDLR